MSAVPGIGRLFGTVADLYDDVRPGYPDELYDRIEATTGPIQGATVLDLAAGTGLQSRALATRGAQVLAVDPDLGMLHRLQSTAPTIPVAAGRGEQIPLKDAAVDLVVCATAWHWLNVEESLEEIRRVLKPGAYLALWWALNAWGDGFDWEDAQSVVFDRWDAARGNMPTPHGGVGPREAAADLRARGIEVVIDEEISWQRTVTREQHMQVLATHSNQLVMPAEDRQKLLAEIETALQPWPTMTERLWGPLIVARF